MRQMRLRQMRLRRMRGPEWVLDVAGHYARQGVFERTVHREAHPNLRVTREGEQPVVSERGATDGMPPVP